LGKRACLCVLKISTPSGEQRKRAPMYTPQGWGWGHQAPTRTLRRHLHPLTRSFRTRSPSTGSSTQRCPCRFSNVLYCGLPDLYSHFLNNEFHPAVQSALDAPLSLLKQLRGGWVCEIGQLHRQSHRVYMCVFIGTSSPSYWGLHRSSIGYVAQSHRGCVSGLYRSPIGAVYRGYIGVVRVVLSKCARGAMCVVLYSCACVVVVRAWWLVACYHTGSRQFQSGLIIGILKCSLFFKFIGHKCNQITTWPKTWKFSTPIGSYYWPNFFFNFKLGIEVKSSQVLRVRVMRM